MDSLPEDPILKFHPDTLETVRKIHNLHRPGDMDNAVTILQEWLEKQHHLTKKDYTRDYLERYLILQKGSLERTKVQLERMCAVRTLLPEFFEKHDTKNDFKDLDGVQAQALLPKLTKDHYRILVYKTYTNEVNAEIFMQKYRYGILLCEYMRAHDYCNGFVGILDYRDINPLHYMAVVNITHLHQMIKLLMEGYGLRIKGLHLIVPSRVVEKFVNMIKKMFGRKVASRIHLHLSIDTLLEHLPKNILPIELGGYDGSLADYHEQWKEVLGTKENVEYFREMNQAKSTEAHKLKDKFHSQDLGLEGSFRSLNVD